MYSVSQNAENFNDNIWFINQLPTQMFNSMRDQKSLSDYIRTFLLTLEIE